MKLAKHFMLGASGCGRIPVAMRGNPTWQVPRVCPVFGRSTENVAFRGWSDRNSECPALAER